MDIAKTIKLDPGHYVVAVSGGVDSVALLDLLVRHAEAHGGKKHRFVVAHFDHGIRDVSHLDRLLVHEIAGAHKLPFVYEEGALGPDASEAEARDARYAFLRKVQRHANAQGIITAHHLDDTIETAVINIMRGTGRKGLSSLKSNREVIRPLLHVPKSHLKAYAEANGLTWHEDSTNQNQDYKRNYVRHTILPKLKAKSPADYHKLVTLLRRQREINHAIDQQLETILHLQPSRRQLRRLDVSLLPYKVACELVAEWLRQNGKRGFNRWLVERLTIAIRTARPDTELLLDSKAKVAFGKDAVEFIAV